MILKKPQILRILLVLAAAAIVVVMSRSCPKDQVIHVVLGDAASRVEEVVIRYGKDEDFQREARFRYQPGKAPRILTHEPRLAEGDYTVEIEVLARNNRNTVRRRVTLAGATTSIDVSEQVPK
jgi:hypothetical protein